MKIWITVSLFHTFHSGRKSKSSSSSVSIDHDLAEGLVDLEKLQSAMESAVGKLQLDFRDKISTKILPSEYWHYIDILRSSHFYGLIFPHLWSLTSWREVLFSASVDRRLQVHCIYNTQHSSANPWLDSILSTYFVSFFLPLIKFTLYIYSLQQIKEQKCLLLSQTQKICPYTLWLNVVISCACNVRVKVTGWLEVPLLPGTNGFLTLKSRGSGNIQLYTWTWQCSSGYLIEI